MDKTQHEDAVITILYFYYSFKEITITPQSGFSLLSGGPLAGRNLSDLGQSCSPVVIVVTQPGTLARRS
jgi:hypothetical protein